MDGNYSRLPALLENRRQGQALLEYLAEHFDVLHTQSKQWLLADIDEFIHIRKDRKEACR